MNKKARKAALASLLTDIRDRNVLVSEPLEFDKPSTKRFAQFLKEKNLNGKVLVLYEKGYGANVIKSARNVPCVKLLHASSINCHDLLNADWILLSPDDSHIVESRIAEAR